MQNLLIGVLIAAALLVYAPRVLFVALALLIGGAALIAAHFLSGPPY
jgi:hypothetical protein